ncbi:alginate export family protein [Geobacter sp. SVR]|uniref:alginate export family protein n=1 Tax=Geobacter sp. SVR TaxID=2495594 RepID=UPI00143EFBB5|nr:alginate export family protein [Geobacter sp. SVR]BCS53200.1 outer membrane channel protein [Geobacter sp. SVR]GCF84585.1 outer membrane channel protein [Geobacter sp. SVR]
MFKRILPILSTTLLLAGAAHAQEGAGTMDQAPQMNQAQEGAGERQIPEQVNAENWAYQEIKDLVDKYEAQKKLPEGKPCSKGELAQCLLSVLEKVVDKYDKEGGGALLRDDLVRISALHEALEGELTKQPEYGAKRASIEDILDLVEPETPAYTYKFGVNGFLRGEWGRNFRLFDGHEPGFDMGQFTWRVKPFAYWHPTDYLDIHLEGQGYGFTGGNGEFDRFNLYQGFVEARTPGHDWAALKGGRQEFVYGSAFIQGADTAFDGMTFDGARLRLKPLAGLSVDLLGGVYAKPFSGGQTGNLWGAYATYAPTEDSTLDLYVFRDNQAAEGEPQRGEYLDTWGLRSVSKLGPLSLEIEPVFQTGKLGGEDVNAYGGHADLTGEFELGGFKNALTFGYAIGSGDQNAADGISSRKEFRNPNNDTSIVGDMHLFGDLSGIDVAGSHASGLQVYTLGWGIELTDSLSFAATGHKFMANNVPTGIVSRHLGIEADFGLTWKIQKNLALTLAYDHFFTEGFFREASGSSKDLSYAYAMLTFNWDKTKRKAVTQ